VILDFFKVIVRCEVLGFDFPAIQLGSRLMLVK